MLKSANNFTKKPINNFHCENCDFICSTKRDYDRHLLTAKHVKANNANAGDADKFTCIICSGIFNHASSLSRHKKKCIENNKINEINKINENNKYNEKNEIHDINSIEVLHLTNLVLEVMKNNTELQKQNNELQKQNQDLNKQVLDVYIHQQPVHINSHNNSHNKTFNLQFFLNEQCKDAMNIMDFVNSVSLQLSDLESVGKLGYVEGISNIMIKKLNEMDIYKRPVHCSDAKRETLYVKDNNMWEKENATHSKLRKAIKYISKKNSDLLIAWRNQYPASKNIHSKQNEEYMKMIYQAMGGVGDVEENENKIIKKISKMVLIDK
jgi:hypothetical protein